MDRIKRRGVDAFQAREAFMIGCGLIDPPGNVLAPVSGRGPKAKLLGGDWPGHDLPGADNIPQLPRGRGTREDAGFRDNGNGFERAHEVAQASPTTNSIWSCAPPKSSQAKMRAPSSTEMSGMPCASKWPASVLSTIPPAQGPQ